MVSISEKFSFSVDSQPSKTLVKVEGSLRRGHVEASDFQRYSSALIEAEKSSTRGILVFDLTALKYWDTLGINSIVPVVERTNAKYRNRSGIIGPKAGLVYQAAFDRHRTAFESNLVPWEESEDALIRKLTGE
jgi:hypothetical protein